MGDALMTAAEQAALRAAGLAVFEDRIVLAAQPPIDHRTLKAIAGLLAGVDRCRELGGDGALAPLDDGAQQLREQPRRLLRPVLVDEQSPRTCKTARRAPAPNRRKSGLCAVPKLRSTVRIRYPTPCNAWKLSGPEPALEDSGLGTTRS
jgi:hypothetical protein